MGKHSDTCFRVSGIPGDCTESQIRALLASGLPLDEDVEVEIFSLARNPLRQDQQIATLSFSRIPATLSERGQQHVDIPPNASENRGPRRKVVVDSHFEGFTPLHATKDNECYMDLVALSGLNGHAFGSFKEKGGSHMWLRDALPYDLPNVRIFTYGYNTSPDKVSFQNVWDIESAFRQRLRMLRNRSGSTTKPFIIVAHSLGGIIAKAAVVKMAESFFDDDSAAFQSLRGVLLFGVPSQGMDIESLIPMVPVSEMRALLYSLDKTNSPTLRELGEYFPKKIRELPDFIAFNFYETRESPTAKRVNEKWVMEGPPTVLVSPFSATQGRLANEPEHRVIPLNNTHSGMIKFCGINDNDYEITLTCLKEIEEHITCGNEVWPTHKLPCDEQDCLKSLAFLEQHSREYDSKIIAAEGTCNWVRTHYNYRCWDSTNSGLLWIMGPPGSGKSTLMKVLVEAERENQRPRNLIATFFVHGRGTEMQKSHLGIYRSLLHQLLPHCRGSLAALTEKYRDRQRIRGRVGKEWNWEEEELRSFFTSTIQAESGKRSITVFIDALDEMGEDSAIRLIMDLQRLHGNNVSQNASLRLCFSSRYYPNLAEEESPSISIEKENMGDINSFIKSHPALWDFGLSISERDAITELIIQRANGIFQWVSLVLDQIMNLRRRGQPVPLVIDTIKRVPRTLHGIYDALVTCKEEEDRKQMLKLFQWIALSFRPLTLEELRQALAIDASMTTNSLAGIAQRKFYYQLKDMRTVLHDLSKGLARLANNDRVETIHQSVNDYLIESGLEKLESSVSGNAEGLAQFQLSRSCIKLLHLVLRSCPTLEPECTSSSKENHSDKAQERIQEGKATDYSICHRNSSMDSWISKTPLARYASAYWSLHIMQVERQNIDQKDLLELLPWQQSCGSLPAIFTFFLVCPPDHLLFSWSRSYYDKNSYGEAKFVYDWIRALFNKVYYHSWDPIHLLAIGGIYSALDEMERVEPGIYDRIDHLGQTTLLFALAGCNEKVVAAAMGVADHHHVRNDNTGISPLFVAVTHSREDWVQAIIDKGADVDYRNSRPLADESITALYQAWSQKDENMVKHLLAGGADPCVVCDVSLFSISVIHQAVWEGDERYEAWLQLLLKSAVRLHPARRLPNLEGFNGETTLSCAIKQNNGPVLKLLLESGADDTSVCNLGLEDDVALLAAAEEGLGGLVKILLDNGTDPNGDILSNRRPLGIALDRGHASVIQAFLDIAFSSGSNTKAKVDDIRRLSWDWYIQPAIKRNCPDIIQTLVKSGADLNIFAHNGKPLLHIAIEENYAELVRILLQSGANPTLRDAVGTTVLQTAIEGNHTEAISMLLEWRDSHARSLIMIEILTFRRFPWSWLSSKRDRLRWVLRQAFLHTKYNFDEQDNDGLTTLWYAVIENIPQVVDLLLDYEEINPNIQNHQGETPLMRAASRGLDRILRLLLAHPLTNIAIEDEDGLTAINHARRAGNSAAEALLRRRQDDLWMELRNRVATDTSERGRSLQVQNALFTGFMGTLRRHRY